MSKSLYKIAFSDETINKLKNIAKYHSVTMTEAIRIAINTEIYIENQINGGNKILNLKKDSLYEITFNQ